LAALAAGEQFEVGAGADLLDQVEGSVRFGGANLCDGASCRSIGLGPLVNASDVSSEPIELAATADKHCLVLWPWEIAQPKTGLAPPKKDSARLEAPRLRYSGGGSVYEECVWRPKEEMGICVC
jgi:hypothetical protein